MATKGNIGTSELARQIELTRKGQDAKREARHAKRRQSTGKKEIVVQSPYIEGDGAALHALFSRTRKTISENHVSRNPSEILRRSHEMKRAMAIHGHEACLRRVYDACIKSGMPEQDSAHFSTEACKR